MRDLFETDGRGATLSGCGRYRYWLERRWGPGPAVCWIMLNPSTADALADDPTIRRCVAFARRWGHGAIEVVNLFAWRATDPGELRSDTAQKVGPDNDRHIIEASDRCAVRVAAWGAHGDLFDRARHVRSLLTATDPRPVFHLGLTKSGQPRHPLYTRADQELVAFDLCKGGDHALCPEPD